MIIGISGKKQSGKNTVGKILQILLENNNISNEEVKNKLNSENSCEYKYKYELIAFADKLKQIASVLLDCSVSAFESEKFKNSSLPSNISTNKNVKTYRQFLQYVGTELFGKLNPNFWVNLLLDKVKPENNYIITDVRFKNEVKAIKNLNGFIIRVISKSYKNDEHISEHDLDTYVDFDWYIYNVEDIDYLISQLKNMITKINKL